MDIDKNLLLKEGRALYFSIIAGGARAKLLESIVNTNLFELFVDKRVLSEDYIIHTLNLNALRAKKWLHLLSMQGFLKKEKQKNGSLFSLGPVAKTLFENDDNLWAACKNMVHYWQTVSLENLSAVLSGHLVQNNANWPPTSYEHALIFEKWMANTAHFPTQAIVKALNHIPISHLLDIGGGDASVACALARIYPHIKFTVYNLPHSIKIAKQRIKNMNLDKQVSVVEGDFLKETIFPSGFDAILFCRVLWDWSLETNRKLLKMTYEALPANGYVIICELFQNQSDPILACEFRYIFLDDMQTEVYKTVDEYKKLLEEIGFKTIALLETETKESFLALIAKK